MECLYSVQLIDYLDASQCMLLVCIASNGVLHCLKPYPCLPRTTRHKREMGVVVLLELPYPSLFGRLLRCFREESGRGPDDIYHLYAVELMIKKELMKHSENCFYDLSGN